jgi:hypothetical protein
MPGKMMAPPPVVEAPKPAPPKEERRAEAPPPPAPPPPPPAAPVAEPPPPPASPLYGPELMACIPALIEDTPAAAAGIGSIVRTDDARVMVSTGDPIHVGLTEGQGVSPGDRLTVFRPGTRVIHPVTGKSTGRVQFLVGILEVQEIVGKTARARVTYNCADIHIGDRLMPYSLNRFPNEKIPQPTAVRAQGVILDSPRLAQVLGTWQLVFLDLGAGQGVGAGDLLSVYRETKPVTNDRGAFFPTKSERLGEALVLRVTEQTATAVLTSAAKECRVGDQVVLTHQVAR